MSTVRRMLRPVKSAAKAVLPDRVVGLRKGARISRGLREAYRYDRERYFQYSSSMGPHASRQNLASRVTERYHNLEKGLALPAPEPGHGLKNALALVGYLRTYRARYGDDEVTAAAMGALRAYQAFNADDAAVTAALAAEPLDALSDEAAARLPMTGGVRELHLSHLDSAVGSVDLDFFTTRRSVRHFAAGAVAQEDLEFAVRAAQSSPAVCNRQFCRVYVTQDPDAIRDALAIQGGARGFAENVPCVAVVTASLRNFWGPGERMQAWTDGGMFLMSFLLGLHVRRLGTVCLNWSKGPDIDRRFRERFDLEPGDVIIACVAIGHLNDVTTVASSPRPPVADALRPLTP